MAERAIFRFEEVAEPRTRDRREERVTPEANRCAPYQHLQRISNLLRPETFAGGSSQCKTRFQKVVVLEK